MIFWTYEGGARSVIVQPRARRRFVLDDTGDLIWRLLACEQSREEITDRIVAVYGVPAEIAASDVDDLITDLSTSGLIERDAALGDLEHGP